MSFRIYIRNYKLDNDYPGEGDFNHQIFGNNEYPELLDEYLRSKDAEIDEDGCFRNFEIKDIQEFMTLVMNIQNSCIESDSWYDFKPNREMKANDPESLISYWSYKLSAASVLILYNLYESIEEYLDLEYSEKNDRYIYKLKEGKKLYLSGF